MICGKCKTQGVTREHVRECYGFSERVKANIERGEQELAEGKPLAMLEDLAPKPRERVYLTVPYAEKDSAKKQGAQWDPAKKRWWVWSDDTFFLKDAPEHWRKDLTAKKQPVEEGIYLHEGKIYKVLTAHYGDAAGHLYCKMFVPFDEDELESEGLRGGSRAGVWEKVSGMQYRLPQSAKLSLKEACKYGKLYGFCVRCGRTLTLEESQERGMGAICAGKM